MMKAAVLVLLAATAAWGGAGAILGEFGFGCAGVFAGSVLPAVIVIYA